VIFNDCCSHVLELPDDGPYVTETCSIRKIHFYCVDGFGKLFVVWNDCKLCKGELV
jgi:hypothetical protein